MCSSLLKNVSNEMFTNHIYLIYIYKEDFALSNLKWLIYHKTQPTKPKLYVQTGLL